MQDGNTLATFVPETGDGGDVFLFQRGNHSVDLMLDKAKADNKALTWILRFLGIILTVSGLDLIFRPIEVFVDIAACVGNIIGCEIFVVSVVILAILSAITVSISWLVAHPKIGGIVLAATFTFVV